MRPSYWYAVIMLLWTTSIEAAEQDIFWLSTRSVARGGTSVAGFDTDEGVRHNPAVLARTKIGFQLRFAELSGFFGDNFLETSSEIAGLGNQEDALAFLGSDTIIGKRQYLGLQGSFLGMRFGQFEIAPVLNSHQYLDVTRQTVLSAEWEIDALVGWNIAYGFTATSSIDVGVAIRPFGRWYAANQIDLVDLLDLISADNEGFDEYISIRFGSGIAADLGFLWLPSDYFRMGLTFQNIFDAGYTQGYDTNPPNLKQTITLGSLVRLPLGSFHLDWSFDYVNIANREAFNVLRLLHTGIELGTDVFGYGNDYGILAGLNEGYFTGGFYMDLYVFRLAYANYGVELGTQPGQRLDRRTSVTLRTQLTF